MLRNRGGLVRTLIILLPTALAAAAAACSGTGSGVGGSDSPIPSTGGTVGDGGTGGTIIGPTGGTGADGTGGGGPVLPAWPDWLSTAWGTYVTVDDDIRSFKEDTLPVDVNHSFDGSPGSGAPEIIYPLDGAMHPRNLTDISFHFSKVAREHTLFRIEAVAPNETFRFYVTCPADPACVLQMPESEWYWLGQEYAGQAVTFTVTETDGDGTIYTSAPITVHYSPEPVLGVLYYWAAADWSINRAQFGSRGSVPFIVPRTDTNQFECAACHSVSRDGTTIAFAVSQWDGESTAAIQTAPTTDPSLPYVEPALGPTPFDPANTPTANPALTHRDWDNPSPVTEGPLDHFGHYVALSPDGSVAAINGVDVEDPGNWPPWFELRDTRSGATLQKIDLGQPPFPSGTMPILPEWSPDGTKIVATLTDEEGACAWTYATCTGGIVVMDVANNQVGAPVTLVNAAPGQFHYYATWSPNGDYVAFVTASGGGPTNKCDVIDTGVLNMVQYPGGPYDCPGPGCIELAAGGQFSSAQAGTAGGVGPHTTMPKFAPFFQADGTVMFIAFTTRIRYGYRSQDQSQIWMFGIDTTRAGDPSYPPIWLPYQDYSDGSLAPFWAEIAPCSTEAGGGCSCSPGEECRFDQNNVCYCIFEPPE